MSTRRIKIYTTLGSPGTIETDATTLGELRPMLSAQSINTSGMKLLVGETRNELSEDVAILPEGDFKLYLVPSKTKSGALVIDSTGKEKDFSDIPLEVKISLVESILSSVQEILKSIKTDMENLDGDSKAKESKEHLTGDEEAAIKDILNILGSRTEEIFRDDEDDEDDDEWES